MKIIFITKIINSGLERKHSCIVPRWAPVGCIISSFRYSLQKPGMVFYSLAWMEVEGKSYLAACSRLRTQFLIFRE